MNDCFGRHYAIASATLLVEKAEDLLQRSGVRLVPKKSSGAADVHESHIPEFFQMMRKRRTGYVQLLLNFPGDHTRRVSSEQQADDLQARFGAESGETVAAAGHQERVRFGHISIIAELWKIRNLFLSETLSLFGTSH